MTQKGRTWSLKLTKVERSQFGKYSCVASNSLGTSQASTEITGEVIVTIEKDTLNPPSTLNKTCSSSPPNSRVEIFK